MRRMCLPTIFCHVQTCHSLLMSVEDTHTHMLESYSQVVAACVVIIVMVESLCIHQCTILLPNKGLRTTR